MSDMSFLDCPDCSEGTYVPVSPDYVVYDEFGRSHGVYDTELKAANAAYVLANVYGHNNVIFE